WYAGATVADTVYLASGVSHTFGLMRGDSVRMVKPVTPGPTPWNRAGGFPPGLFTVHAPASSTPAPMRWTGVAGNSWHNPANWVQQTQSGNATYEMPVSWPPSRCTDVEISSDAPFYPELTDTAYCADITLKDRAMLKNPHVLVYDSAWVELLLRATERDRFVMWSPPLRDMYSGDYHFTDGNGNPRWGDVSMNFFQLANPSGGAAQANMFTATFGSPGETLPLGKAFNLWVTSTGESRNRPLIFPQAATSYAYTDPAGQSRFTGTLIRGNGSRFITDGVTPDTDGLFDMPVFGGGSGQMVQIVNPYLAYLRADSFLKGNEKASTPLASNGYLLWDGRVDNGFVSVKFADDGMRYLASIPNGDFTASPEYIPPQQSFFVVKNSSAANVSTVKMSPRWTTTKPSGAYRLRMSEAGNGVLHIRAIQGRSESYAALHFDKNRAVPEYRGSEDVRALFYDANPLSVYVLTPLGEPLAISADGEYHTHTTALGLRLTQSGEVTLAFDGQDLFGHDVYLVDRALNREVFLQEMPAYTFMAVKPTGVDVLEMNDRFVLRMEYTGVHSAPPATPPSWTVVALKGEIHVRATGGGLIDEVRVYNVGGSLIHAAQTASDYFRIASEPGQVYFVRVRINGAYETRKVMGTD
ncbi:MAG: hypothetical protein LBJ01_00690, partial [Tannerella sp.]|nr:hypothetical protein [Tannerella sp.]